MAKKEMDGDMGWGTEKPPMSPEEKADSEVNDPVVVITAKGQFIVLPDGTKEKIGPDHPLYYHKAGV